MDLSVRRLGEREIKIIIARGVEKGLQGVTDKAGILNLFSLDQTPPGLLLQKGSQLFTSAGMSHFLECLGFDLSNPLSCHIKVLPYFLKGRVSLFSYAEPHPQNFLLFG